MFGYYQQHWNIYFYQKTLGKNRIKHNHMVFFIFIILLLGVFFFILFLLGFGKVFINMFSSSEKEESQKQYETERLRNREQIEIQRNNKIEADKKSRVLEIADVDSMPGLDFEHYVAKLLVHHQFKAKVTKGSGDLGVDIVAEKEGKKYAIQVKRYGQPVSRRAISDSVAGKNFYNCDSAMVITNNYFTKDAKTLAIATGCELVDRDKLTTWILDFQSSKVDDFNKGESKVNKPERQIIKEINSETAHLRSVIETTLPPKNKIEKIYTNPEDDPLYPKQWTPIKSDKSL